MMNSAVAQRHTLAVPLEARWQCIIIIVIVVVIIIIVIIIIVIIVIIDKKVLYGNEGFSIGFVMANQHFSIRIIMSGRITQAILTTS